MTPDAERTYAACLEALLQAHEDVGVQGLRAQRRGAVGVAALCWLHPARLSRADRRAALAEQAYKI
jgi:hypothetical protein